MKALFRITIYGAFFMALMRSALGQNIQNDFDHQADFSQYKSFSWLAIKAGDSLWDTRIENAVNAQLVAKGLTQADNGRGLQFPAQADNGPGFPFPLRPPPPPTAALPEAAVSCKTSAPCVAIVAIQTTRTETTLQTFFDGIGGGWGWRGGFGSATTTAQHYKEGTLVIDIYDVKTKQLIWRGSAEGTLSDKASKNEKKLETVVAKMFKDYPPRSTNR